MFAYLSRRGAHLTTAARLRRVIASLAVVTGALLGWAGAVPVASAEVIPPQGGPYGPVPATPGGAVQMITVGGMPGWQITVIAVTAALAAAAAAVLLDRARVSRRTAATTG